MWEGGNIGLLGGGNMGEAIVKGLLASEKVRPSGIFCLDIEKTRLTYLEKEYGIKPAVSVVDIVKSCSTLVIAVKPGQVKTLLCGLAPELRDDSLVISIAAGVSIGFLKKYLGEHIDIVRVMPNTPCLVLEGISVIAHSGVADRNLQIARDIFESLGKAVVLDEVLMDAVTGLSGSGPAFAFLAMDAMSVGGVKMGLPRKSALLLAAQTFLGAAKMVLETGLHPEELRDRVSSPGGTTVAGVHRLESGGFRSSLIDAVEAATLRSRELGKSLEE